MQLLHETPVLTRDRDPHRAGAAVAGRHAAARCRTALQALFTSELAEQVEQIKITPQSLNTEEISRMWTAFQAHYRPTAAYQVSVVLIESTGVDEVAAAGARATLYVVPFSSRSSSRSTRSDSAGRPDPVGINRFSSAISLPSRDTASVREGIQVLVGGIDSPAADADVERSAGRSHRSGDAARRACKACR